MSRAAAFAPYASVSLLHLIALASGWADGSTWTKPLLMPALFLALVLAVPVRRSRLLAITALAILCSWGGDVLLETPGDIGFLLGLGAFLLAHLAYIALFVGPLRERRIPLPTLAFLGWWGALVIVLAPDAGPLLVPVALYGIVLAGSGATAFGANRFVAIGALVFLASDTLLAFRLFRPDFDPWQIDAVIMLLYTLGQGLIVWGAVTRARTVPSRPVG